MIKNTSQNDTSIENELNLSEYGDKLHCIYPDDFKEAKKLGVLKYGYDIDSMAAHLFATGYIEGCLVNQIGNKCLQ